MVFLEQVFSNEFDDDLTATFLEVSGVNGKTHSHGPPVQCSARSSIDRQRACCMVDYLAPLEWSEWSKLPHRKADLSESAEPLLVAGQAAAAAAAAALDDEMNPVHALEVCNKADLDGRNMSERGAGTYVNTGVLTESMPALACLRLFVRYVALTDIFPEHFGKKDSSFLSAGAATGLRGAKSSR